MWRCVDSAAICDANADPDAHTDRNYTAPNAHAYADADAHAHTDPDAHAHGVVG
ncbi:hypothetical protein ABIB37_002077 [Agrococcus sp. UYP10]